MYLRDLICKGTKTKLGSVRTADQMQSNGPTLRSQANFYGDIGMYTSTWLFKKPQGFEIIFITSQLAYGPQICLCVDPPFAQKLYREQYFRTCTLGAT